MQKRLLETTGGITAPLGFRACGVAAGIKAGKNDMALLVSDSPAHVAGVFTTNAVQAAPVKLDRRRVAGGCARAVVVNSGNANACTGSQGMADALEMTVLAARALEIDPEEVLVCSTGVIGVPLPMERIRAGIPLAVAALSPDGGNNAARAIMTTDTVDKQHAVQFEIDGCTVTLGGMAKGSGMIEPNMATMLAFITTDAEVQPADLHSALKAVCDQTFNRISVDGDCSTNDTVLLLANGQAGAPALTPAHPGWSLFLEALREVCRHLAEAIVLDGEGASKCVALLVRGAANSRDAECAARAIANSALVKTSWFGADPNWGRVIAALGYSGAAMDEARVSISYNGTKAYAAGHGMNAATRARLVEILKQPRFELCVDLDMGNAECRFLTCDLSLDYVRINADYTT